MKMFFQVLFMVSGIIFFQGCEMNQAIPEKEEKKINFLTQEQLRIQLINKVQVGKTRFSKKDEHFQTILKEDGRVVTTLFKEKKPVYKITNAMWKITKENNLCIIRKDNKIKKHIVDCRKVFKKDNVYTSISLTDKKVWSKFNVYDRKQ